MAIPASRDGLKDYCLRRLGYPVIQINVDDAQIEDRIDDALQLFSEYHFDGVEKVYIRKQVEQKDVDRGYIDITEPTVADPNAEIPIVDAPAIDPDGRSLISIVKCYQLFDMQMLQDLLTPEKSVEFSRVTNRIYVNMDWKGQTHIGEYMMFEGYKILNPEIYTDIYNDMMLKRYTTALIQQQWGSNMMKFGGVELPGGITLNGSDIFNQATNEVSRIETDIQSKWELPPQFIVG